MSPISTSEDGGGGGDLLLDSLKATHSLLQSGNRNNYLFSSDNNDQVQEAIQEFISSSNLILRELNVTSLSNLHVEVLNKIRNLLMTSSQLWDPLRMNKPTAAAHLQNQNFRNNGNQQSQRSSSSPSLSDIQLNPVQVAVRSASSAVAVQCQKQLLLNRSQKLLDSLIKRNETVSKVLTEFSGNFEETMKVADARNALLSPEHLETLDFTSDIYKSKIEVLQKEVEANGETSEDSEIRESLERLMALRSKKAALDKEIAKISADGALPPNMQGALERSNQRQSYLDELVKKIDEQSQQDFLTQSGLDLSLNDLI